jgi:hypothetical protein
MHFLRVSLPLRYVIKNPFTMPLKGVHHQPSYPDTCLRAYDRLQTTRGGNLVISLETYRADDETLVQARRNTLTLAQRQDF